MEVTRRDTMAIGGAAVISTLIPSISVASTNDLIMGITGGADASSFALTAAGVLTISGTDYESGKTSYEVQLLQLITMIRIQRLRLSPLLSMT